jgi:hypothetical protein
MHRLRIEQVHWSMDAVLAATLSTAPIGRLTAAWLRHRLLGFGE